MKSTKKQENAKKLSSLSENLCLRMENKKSILSGNCSLSSLKDTLEKSRVKVAMISVRKFRNKWDYPQAVSSRLCLKISMNKSPKRTSGLLLTWGMMISKEPSKIIRVILSLVSLLSMPSCIFSPLDSKNSKNLLLICWTMFTPNSGRFQESWLLKLQGKHLLFLMKWSIRPIFSFKTLEKRLKISLWLTLKAKSTIFSQMMRPISLKGPNWSLLSPKIPAEEAEEKKVLLLWTLNKSITLLKLWQPQRTQKMKEKSWRNKLKGCSSRS